MNNDNFEKIKQPKNRAPLDKSDRKKSKEFRDNRKNKRMINE
jgi:hypothetical protein